MADFKLTYSTMFNPPEELHKGFDKAVVKQKGNATQATLAIEAARKAFPAWSRTPWQKRVQLVRKAAANIEKRIFELGAAMALEVGKNRMESLGDVQETADLMYFSAQMMEENDGFIKA